MANLKQFQKKCIEIKKKEDEAARLKLIRGLIAESDDVKLMEGWTILKEAQERYGSLYEPIGEWGGLRKPKCPCCEETLEKRIIKSDGLCEYHILYCLDCGYHFARAMRT